MVTAVAAVEAAAAAAAVFFSQLVALHGKRSLFMQVKLTLSPSISLYLSIVMAHLALPLLPPCT